MFCNNSKGFVRILSSSYYINSFDRSIIHRNPTSKNNRISYAADCIKPKMKFIEIGVNLSDRMYQGEYNGSKKHDSDLLDVLERSWKAGIEYMIITGGSFNDASQAIKLSTLDERLFATVGCHPTRCEEFLKPLDELGVDKDSISNAEDDGSAYFNALHQLILNNKEKVVAIGECGLDYDRLQFCPKEVQLKYFEKQLELASTTQLPLFLHCRNAASDLIEILERNRDKLPKKVGVVHSFDGSYEEANRFIELGFLIGINGCSLKTEANLDVVRQIPIDKLMMETDAPWCEIRPTHASAKYLKDKSLQVTSVKKEKWKPGVMVKGRNEPCNIRQVLEVLSGLQEAEDTNAFKEELANTIYKSTADVFIPSK